MDDAATLIAEYSDLCVITFRTIFTRISLTFFGRRLSNYVGIVASGECTRDVLLRQSAADRTQWLIPVVFLYECVITIGGEVELFWFAKWTGATILYLLNRYIVGFYSFYILATSFVPVSDAVRTIRTPRTQ